MDAVLKGHPYVKSGIDIACWDILGQASGLPVCDAARRTLRRGLRALSRDLAGIAGRDGGAGRGVPRRGLPALPAQGGRRSRRRRRAHPRRARRARARATCSWPTPTRAGCRTRRRASCAPCATWTSTSSSPARPTRSASRSAGARTIPSSSTRRSTGSESCCARPGDRAMDVVNIKIRKFGGLTRARQARDLCVSLGIAMTIEDSWGGDVTTAAIAHLAHSTPTEFLFTSTDFNSYVTVSTADGRARSAGTAAWPPRIAPGLGITPGPSSSGRPAVDVPLIPASISGPCPQVPESLPADVQALIDEEVRRPRGALDQDRWRRTRRTCRSSSASPPGRRRRGAAPQAIAWLRLLAEFHDVGDSASRTRVLLEIARMSPTDARGAQGADGDAAGPFRRAPGAFRRPREVSRSRAPGSLGGRRPDRALAVLPAERDLLHAGPRRRTAGRDESGARRHAARGRRRQACRSRSSRPRRTSCRCRRRTSCAGRSRTGPGLAALAEKDPAETLRWLLASFGRSLTVQEVKDHFSGVVPEERWTRLLDGGPQEPPGAGLGKLEVRHGHLERERRRRRGDASREALREGRAGRADRSRAQARQALEGPGALLRRGARRGCAPARPARPALAWELSQAALRLAPGEPEAYPAAALLAARDLRPRPRRRSATTARARRRSSRSARAAPTGPRSSSTRSAARRTRAS